MKKLSLTLLLLTTLLNFCFSQTNTFPSSGNVGIGTLSPIGRLQVQEGSYDLLIGGSFVDIGLNGITGSWARAFRIVNTSNSNGQDGGAFGVYGTGTTPAYAFIAIPTADVTGYNSSKILVLNNSGNVGIGTTAPGSTLQVAGDARFGTNGTYTDLRLFTDAVLTGYNQTNSITPTVIPGEGTAYTAFHLKNAVSAGKNQMDLIVDGSIGVGITGRPAALIYAQGLAEQFRMGYDAADYNSFIVGSTGSLAITAHGTNPNITLAPGGTGNVGIGTIHPLYTLDVYGIIHAKQVNVDASGTPDYVFDKDYHLPTLAETAAYIDKNHHLSEIPSAAEITKDGLNLGEMNKLLLKKVEELTLYLIEKDKTEKEQSGIDKQQGEQLKLQQIEINELKEQVKLLLKANKN